MTKNNQDKKMTTHLEIFHFLDAASRKICADPHLDSQDPQKLSFFMELVSCLKEMNQIADELIDEQILKNDQIRNKQLSMYNQLFGLVREFIGLDYMTSKLDKEFFSARNILYFEEQNTPELAMIARAKNVEPIIKKTKPPKINFN